MTATTATSDAGEQQRRLEAKLRRELGQFVLDQLRAPDTEDIVLNPDSSLWVKKRGRAFERAGRMDEAPATSALSTIAAIRGQVLNHERPIIETELVIDDVIGRLEGLIPPVVHKPVFAIRLRPKTIYTLDEYTQAGILSYKDDPLNKQSQTQDFLSDVRGMHHQTVIERAVAAKKNILLVGSGGAGKTTFVNAMLHALAEITPDDRILMIEDTEELQCSAKNVVALRETLHVSMLECLRAAMRLKPHRIVVGEVRGAEAHVLLKAWNTGHPGGMATIHADDAMGGLLRLESLVAEATVAPQQQLIAEAVGLVVFISEEPTLAAHRKVKQLAYVTGYRGGRYELEYL